MLLIPEGIVNLNDSAAAILELVDGSRSVAGIAGALAGRYNAGLAEITSDIEDLLTRIAERGWLVLPAKTISP